MTVQHCDISNCPRDPALGPTIVGCLFGGVLYGAEATPDLAGTVDFEVIDLDNTPDAPVPEPTPRACVLVVEGGQVTYSILGHDLHAAGVRLTVIDFTDRPEADATLPTLPATLTPIY